MRLVRTNSIKFKEFLAYSMAEIDAMNFRNKTYDEHYNELMQWNDFDLLSYWMTYNGVFDGGESNLESLKILIKGSLTINPKSIINDCNL
jgi:hypothetical protein